MPGPHKAEPEMDKCVFVLVIGVGALPAMSSQALYTKPGSSFHKAAAELRSKRCCYSKSSEKGLYCIYVGQESFCMWLRWGRSLGIYHVGAWTFASCGSALMV